MPIVEAIVLLIFGIILPSWDVGSDIAFSHSFLSTKPCNFTWVDYVRNVCGNGDNSDENPQISDCGK